MLQRTVMPKKSLCPTSEAITITPFTNRYGASFRRNRTTGSASQRRHSSGVGAGEYKSSVAAVPYGDDVRGGGSVLSAGIGTDVRGGMAGRVPGCSGTTRAAGEGDRRARGLS